MDHTLENILSVLCFYACSPATPISHLTFKSMLHLTQRNKYGRKKTTTHNYSALLFITLLKVKRPFSRDIVLFPCRPTHDEIPRCTQSHRLLDTH